MLSFPLEIAGGIILTISRFSSIHRGFLSRSNVYCNGEDVYADERCESSVFSPGKSLTGWGVKDLEDGGEGVETVDLHAKAWRRTSNCAKLQANLQCIPVATTFYYYKGEILERSCDCEPDSSETDSRDSAS